MEGFLFVLTNTVSVMKRDSQVTLRECNTPCLLMLGPPLPRQLQGFSEKHLTIALEVGDRAGEGKAYRGLLLQDHQEFDQHEYLKLLGNHNISPAVSGICNGRNLCDL